MFFRKIPQWFLSGSNDRRLRAALLLGAFLWSLQFVIVAYNSVDVPYFDEWDMSNLWGPKLKLSDLFARQMEHRIPFTNMQTWLAAQLVGGNLITQILLSYLLFGVECLLLARVCGGVPGNPAWVAPAFLIFCLSPNAYANHSVAFQSQFHFTLLFLFAEAICLFRKHAHPGWILAGGICGVCSMYSFSAGLPAALLVFAGFLAFLFLRSTPSSSSLALAPLAALGTLIAGAMLWFGDYGMILDHALPNQWAFWRFWSNLISFGFGFRTPDIVWAVLCSLVVVIPVGWVARSKLRELDPSVWRVAAVTSGILVAIGVFAYGRGQLDSGKSSRYFEFAVPLVPLSAVLWSWISRANPRRQKAVLTGFWVFCFLNYLDCWNYHHYKNARKSSLTNVECIKRYYAGTGPPICPYPVPKEIRKALDAAREYHLTLYRNNAPRP